MHLNIDCVRDILLSVEYKPYGEDMRINKLCEALPSYSEDEISYACLKLKEGGYLEAVITHSISVPAPIVVAIRELTFSGHQFLDNIRDSQNWDKTKEIGKKAGSVGLNMLAKIAEGVVSAYLKTQFGI